MAAAALPQHPPTSHALLDSAPLRKVSFVRDVGAVSQGPVIINGAVIKPTDFQLYSFSVAAGTTVGFTVVAVPGSGFDSVARIFDVNGNQEAIASPLTLVSDRVTFKFKFVQAGTHFLGISGYPNFRYDPATGAGTVAGTTGGFTVILKPNPPDIDPNDTIRRAVSIGSAGRIQQISDYTISSPTDVDFVRFTARARQQVTIVVGKPAGSGLVPFLRLFNAQGRQLARSALGLLTFKFPATGTYYVGVSGRGNASYNPNTGTGDRAGSTGGYSIAITPGRLVDRDRNSRIESALKLGTLRAARHVDSLPVGTDLDLAGPRRVVSTIATPTDVDVFNVRLAAGQRVAFQVAGRGTLRPFLRLFDGNGVELARGAGAPLTFAAPIATTYFVAVSALGNSRYDPVTGTGIVAGAGTGSYVLTITPKGTQRIPVAVPGRVTLLSYSARASGAAGLVFFDRTGSGQPQPANGEPAHVVFFDRNNNNLRDDGETATLSNAQGQFLLNRKGRARLPIFASPAVQLDIAVEKVTTPQQGDYPTPLTPGKLATRLSFGMSRFEA